jgi:enhancer of polycomb-like protein
VKLDIPVPRINVVQSYELDVPANFKIPLSFTRYIRPTPEEWTATLEYIADAEDESWLYHNSKFGTVAVSANNDGGMEAATMAATFGDSATTHRPHLPLSIFERMFDHMEKATAFEFIISMQQADTLFQEKIPQLYQIFPSKPRKGASVTVKQVIQEVYDYWVQKRSKLKRPLLRRFWPVTSSDDTNPHMVFRPREKEKYKLRKKRQNDAASYRKMKQLRDDLDNLRAVLDLVRRREEIHRVHVKLQIDHFQQRLYDIVDTSGVARQSHLISKEEVKQVLDVPSYFDVQLGGQKAKRTRLSGSSGMSALSSSSSNPFFGDKDRVGRFAGNGAGVGVMASVAGRNNGEPAPNFLHPLPTRERYVSSWEESVPHLPTYEDSHMQPTFRFRHRPRVGRGGRLCIDRVPQPLPAPDNAGAMTAPVTVFTAGFEMLRSVNPKERLLELLPTPLDHEALNRRIEAITAASLKDDMDARKAVSVMGSDAEENDGEEVIVKLDDWIETDEQLWGEERYSIGPI